MNDPTTTPDQAEQKEVPSSSSPATPISAPVTGQRVAFKDLKRQLTPDELSNTGTQKLILDALICAEEERNDLKAELKIIVSKYHDADKLASVLDQKLKTNKANEVLFGVLVGFGCGCIGLAPFFWDNKVQGIIALTLGVVATVIGTLCRIFNK
jgi:hypothetical protein